MTTPRLLSLRFLACAFLLVAGCASEADDVSDDADTSEDALSAACELGKTCASSYKLLAAKSFPNGAPANFRSDVRIASSSQAPRIVRQATSRSFTRTTAAGLGLRGATPGTAWKVSDVLLVEVLDSANGARIDAAYVGDVTSAPVALGGASVRRLGIEAFEHAAGEIDLGAILPTNRAFRVRLTALDLGGDASVTDVYADVTSAPAPPVDPAPVGAPRYQSVLAGSATPMGRDFTAALETRTVIPGYWCRSVPNKQCADYFVAILKYGTAFSPDQNATITPDAPTYFDLSGSNVVDKARLQAIASAWTPKLAELRARVIADRDAASITGVQANDRLQSLRHLELFIEQQVTTMIGLFDRYPTVSKIVLDFDRHL